MKIHRLSLLSLFSSHASSRPAAIFTGSAAKLIPALSLAAALCAAGTARAQYTVVGTTPGGGEIIEGNGTLGALSNASSPALSAGGFDQVTLNIGSIASTNASDVILFSTSGNTLTNNGLILEQGAFNAVEFLNAGGPLNSETIVNNGAIMVVNPQVLNGQSAALNNTAGTTGGLANNGIALSGGSVNNFTLTNNNLIQGSPFTLTNVSSAGVIQADGAVGGVAATGAAITTGGGIFNVSITNKGTISGGGITSMDTDSFAAFVNGAGSAGGVAATGIALTSMGPINTITITNNGGTITGGGVGGVTNVSEGGISTGISPSAGAVFATGVALTSYDSIAAVTINNASGTITGGGIGIGTNFTSSAAFGGNESEFFTGAIAASGVALTATGQLTQITLNNGGTITSGGMGSFNSAAQGGFNQNPDHAGGIMAVGAAFTSTGSITGLMLTNTGAITGGGIGLLNDAALAYNNDVNNTGAIVVTGVAVTSGSGLSTVTIQNSGLITGGGMGSVTAATLAINNSLNDTGAIAATGLALTSAGAMDTVTIKNALGGTISGGGVGDMNTVSPAYNQSANDTGGELATGIGIAAAGGLVNATISNAGTITGGGVGALNGPVTVAYNQDNNDTGAHFATGIGIAAGNTAGLITIYNSGLVTGGGIGNINNASVAYNQTDYDAGGVAATGIAVSTVGGLNALSITNQGGTITGGGVGTIMSLTAGYNQTVTDAGGIFATGIAVSTAVQLNGLNIVNDGGVITGGGVGDIHQSTIAYNQTTNDAGGIALVGIAVSSGGDINGVTITNSGGSIASGGIAGGLNNVNLGYNQTVLDAGGNALDGIAIAALGNVAGVTINNASGGSITGGSVPGGIVNNSNVGYNQTTQSAGGDVGNGIAIAALGNVSASITNGAGATISGGNIGDITLASTVGINGASDSAGANVATGIAVTTASAVNGLALNNSGVISGGNIGNLSGAKVGENNAANSAGANVATGVAISSVGGLSNLSIMNSGAIHGGSLGGINTSYLGLNFYPGDAGANIASGIAINTAGTITNLSIVNTGVISGGNLGAMSGATFFGNFSMAAGSGIMILGADGSNINVANFGYVSGGNTGATGFAGAPAGIFVKTNSAVIDNWGVVSAGNGLPTAAVPGFPSVAISVNGNNNAINLRGHSSVNGTLQGNGINNFLNLDFSGVSAAAQANLKAQLAAQGWTPGSEFTGAFTLRGVTYTVDPLILTLGGITSYQSQGLTQNQQAIGASLDSALVNPAPGTPLFTLFNTIDQSNNIPAALEALSPQQYQAYGDLAISNATAMVQSVDARLNNIRDGSESIDTTGIGGGVVQADSGYSKNDGKQSKEVQQPLTVVPNRWGFFATGNGLFFRGNSHDVDLQSTKANTAGTVAGVDAKAGDHAVIGALFAYNNSSATFGSGDSKSTIESYSGGLYGSWSQDGFYANGLAAYTHNNYSTGRNIVFPGYAATAQGNTHGNQYTANLDGGYDWHVSDRVTLGPLVGVQYVHLDVSGFNEYGATAANLAVGNQSLDSLQSRVGARADYHLLTTGRSSFAAEVHAAWQHEYLNDSRAIGASFIGDGLAPFSVQTSSPLRDAGVVGLGVNFTFRNRLTLFADYELQMWRTSTYSQSVNGGGRISF